MIKIMKSFSYLGLKVFPGKKPFQKESIVEKPPFSVVFWSICAWPCWKSIQWIAGYIKIKAMRMALLPVMPYTCYMDVYSEKHRKGSVL